MGESALLLLRMIGSLAVVVALLWVLTKWARVRGLGTSGQDLIDIRAQRGLSRNTSLILVQVGAKHLLLGVADGGVRVLSEGDELVTNPIDGDESAGSVSDRGSPRSPSAPGSAPSSASTLRAPSSDRLLDRLRDRTVRKQR